MYISYTFLHLTMQKYKKYHKLASAFDIKNVTKTINLHLLMKDLSSKVLSKKDEKQEKSIPTQKKHTLNICKGFSNINCDKFKV